MTCTPTGQLIQDPIDVDTAGTENLLARLAEQPAPSAQEAERITEEVVRRHRWLVRLVARRYGGRGELGEELVQVGYIGLMNAIRRFDPAYGGDFLAYARPTVFGEVKRHFRDQRRWVRLPRRLQELQAQTSRARAELTQTTGHEPTTAELAERLGAEESDVARAQQPFRPISLDRKANEDDADGATLGEMYGEWDERIDQCVDMQALRPALAALPLREKKIILLRFFGNLTQADIARTLGISQMHVSRLIDRTCGDLRRDLVDA